MIVGAKLVAFILMLAIFLPGCTVLSDRRVAAGCQVVDGATTYYALTHGAVESNSVISGFSPAGILFLKLVFAYVIYKVLPDQERASSGDKFMAGAITVIGCAPVPNNLKVIRGLK